MGVPQQSPWQQWLLIHKQKKQQWITSNQAQSAEGVIMHNAAAPLSLSKPSLPPPPPPSPSFFHSTSSSFFSSET